MNRRGATSGGGASSLGYIFGADDTALRRPHNRVTRHPQPLDDDSMTMQQQQHASSTGGSVRRYEHGEDHPGYDTPASGHETPMTEYHTPGYGYDTPSRSEYATSGPPSRSEYANSGPPSRSEYANSGPPSSAMSESHCSPSPMQQQHQFHYHTRAPSRVVHDGGGMSLDMSGGSMMGHDNYNYFRADGRNSGRYITDRPSIRVHGAPGGGSSSLGYLFGGS